MKNERTAKRLRWGFLFILLVACVWAGRYGGGGDFFVLRQSVIAAWRGSFSNVYLKKSSGPFFYPPFALVFFGVFALVNNVTQAVVINIGIHIISYLGFWWGISRLFPSLFRAQAFWLWLMCFCFSIAPLHLDFMGQNINLPLAMLLILIEVIRQRGDIRSQFLCGVLSALVAWVKIFPAFVTVTYFFNSRNSHFRKGIFVGGLIGLFAPFVCFPRGGMELYRFFIDTLFVYHDKNGIAGNASLNLPGLIANWGARFLTPSLTHGMTTLLPIAVALVFWVWITKQSKKNFPNQAPDFWALSVGLMAFLNSASRPDYFMFYVPLFCSVSVRWPSLPTKAKTGLCLSFILVAMTQQAMVGRALNIELQYARVPVIGMAILILTSISVLKSRTQEEC